MEPEGGDFFGRIPKPVLFGGAGLLLALVYFWYKNKQSASSSNNTASPYGTLPSVGSGAIEPIVIQSGGAGAGATGPAGPPGPPGLPGPTKSPTPATTTVPAGLANTLDQRLNALVGILSAQTGANSTAAQRAALASRLHLQNPYGTNPLGMNLFEQEQNVGVISNQIKSYPGGAAAATTLAKQMAARDGYQWTQLNSVEQNEYSQIANVQLLTQANPRR